VDKLKEKSRFWNLKEEELDHTLWISGFGRDYEHVARQTTE
jgi:hypothetical protein